MIFLKSYFIFNLLFGVNNKVFSSEAQSELLDLIQSCESEVHLKESEGSCFLLGIHARKMQNLSLHTKIEGYCIDIFSKTISKNYIYFEDFLDYYPKCNYIILSQIKTSKSEPFDSDKESDDLVRFLNSPKDHEIKD